MSHRNSKLKKSASERTKYRYRMRNDIPLEKDKQRLSLFQKAKDNKMLKTLLSLNTPK